jgi:hypothetical protein
LRVGAGNMIQRVKKVRVIVVKRTRSRRKTMVEMVSVEVRYSMM